MKKGIKKCNNCGEYGKHKYKKDKKVFCTPKCKREYYLNDIPTQHKRTKTLFNKLVAKDQACAKCGQRFEVMQCSHVYSVGHAPGLRYDILNVLPMCGHCHNYWWHLEPVEAFRWFESKYPERLAYLDFAKNVVRPWTAHELHQIKKCVREKNLKALVRFKEEYHEHLKTLDK